MTVDLEAVKRNIRDMLNLDSNNGATEGEIDNAIRLARRLLERHHLDEADVLKEGQAKAEDREVMDRQAVHSEGREVSFWEVGLTNFIVDLIGSIDWHQRRCGIVRKNGIAVLRNGKPIEKAAVCFYGPSEEVALATDLFETMRTTIIAAARLKFGGAQRGIGREYCEGFTLGLEDKLKAGRETDARISADSRALIVRSTALAKATRQRAASWLEKTHGCRVREVKAHSAGITDAGAFEEGRTDGQRASVDVKRRNKVGGGSQPRLTG